MGSERYLREAAGVGTEVSAEWQRGAGNHGRPAAAHGREPASLPRPDAHGAAVGPHAFGHLALVGRRVGKGGHGAARHARGVDVRRLRPRRRRRLRRVAAAAASLRRVAAAAAGLRRVRLLRRVAALLLLLLRRVRLLRRVCLLLLLLLRRRRLRRLLVLLLLRLLVLLLLLVGRIRLRAVVRHASRCRHVDL